ncbi:hypothetical protein HYR53_10710 [Candidatus Acetothermia bacterium]|nr:hypothetical protein [Candidatus Acetothermia bacterium]
MPDKEAPWAGLLSYSQLYLDFIIRWGEQIDSKAYSLIGTVGIFSAVLSALLLTPIDTNRMRLVILVLLLSLVVSVIAAIVAIRAISLEQLSLPPSPASLIDWFEKETADLSDAELKQKFDEGLSQRYSEIAKDLVTSIELRAKRLKFASKILVASIIILILGLMIWSLSHFVDIPAGWWK